MTIIGPDLNYTVGLESQFMQVIQKPHLNGVRHTLCYVSAIVDYGLFYEASTKLQVHGYINADWASSISDRSSTNGFMFSFGSVDVTWSNKKQPTVALSSTKAEYMGAAMATCEVTWFRKLLGDLGLHVDRQVVIYCDNLSNIQLARNPMFHARTKHIEVHYHFIRDKILAGEIDFIYVSTEDQVADIFTKVLGAEKHRQFRNMFGVMELELSLKGSVEMSSSTRANTHDVLG
jgi:histone deacetylase 1/2